jgi:hypothetical protein
VQIVQRVLELKRSIKVALLSVLVLILVLVFFPFQTTTVPAWSFRVVDDSESPVAGINVTEHWQHYLIESEGHEEPKVTASDGSVSFPERTVRANLIWRLARTLRSLGRTGVERRRNAHASVVIWGSRKHSLTTYVRIDDEMLPEKIVVRKQ